MSGSEQAGSQLRRNGISSEDRLFAAGAHGVSFLEGGVIGPLAIYLFKRDQSEFIAFHALQSLYFGIAMMVIILITCGLGAFLVLPYFLYEIKATLAANDGEWYLLPFVGTMAWNKHNPETARERGQLAEGETRW
jgi:uncharacterized membrane protein